MVTLELLDHAPEIFDEVKLAVELGEEDAEVTTGFDDFLGSRPQIGHCHKVVFSKCRAPYSYGAVVLKKDQYRFA